MPLHTGPDMDPATAKNPTTTTVATSTFFVA
jgi:hypothetical protein